MALLLRQALDWQPERICIKQIIELICMWLPLFSPEDELKHMCWSKVGSLNSRDWHVTVSLPKIDCCISRSAIRETVCMHCCFCSPAEQVPVRLQTVNGYRQAEIPAPPAPQLPSLGPIPMASTPVPSTSQAPSPSPSLPVMGGAGNESLALVAYTVPDGGQCGGKGFFCRYLVPNQCKDAVWEQASCNDK